MFNEIKIKEDNSSDNDNDISTSTDAYNIDYDKLSETIYNSTYNALVDYEQKNSVLSTESDIQIAQKNSSAAHENVIQFASSTDASLYTCSTVNAPQTVAEQVGAFTLDIRNILLLFLLIYLVINIYSKLKNTMIRFFKGD